MPLDEDEEAGRVEWPTLAAFKEEVDGRMAQSGRVLPKPRLNRVSREVWDKEGLRAFNNDGTVPWRNREILVTEGRVLLPGIAESPPTKSKRIVEFKGVEEEKPIDEMRLREMPGYLQDMLLWLYESGGETDDDSNK